MNTPISEAHIMERLSASITYVYEEVKGRYKVQKK